MEYLPEDYAEFALGRTVNTTLHAALLNEKICSMSMAALESASPPSPHAVLPNCLTAGQSKALRTASEEEARARLQLKRDDLEAFARALASNDQAELVSESCEKYL